MNVIRKYIKDRRRVFLFLSFLFLSSVFAAQTAYDINDPRNPNCPCHKYQKMADEEFRKMLRNGNKGAGELASNTVSLKDKTKKARIEKYKRKKYKIKGKHIREPKWLYEFRHSGFWKRVTSPVKCPIWNG